MNAKVWKRKKKYQAPIEEDTNREGQWTREFSVRAESWPLIEHWAHERGFHMVACKAHRRMYKKGSDDHYYATYLDIRHDETRVVLTSWIQVGFRLRLLSLFFIPKTLRIEATGFRGTRTKRHACHDLNVLLDRFRQRHIVGSHSLHLADLDLSSLLLMASMISAMALFSTYTAAKMEIAPGLSNSLMTELLNRLAVLSGAGIILFAIHHWAIAKRMEELWKKALSASLVALVFSGAALFQLTRTVSEYAEQKVTHHCLMHFDGKSCSQALSALSTSDREKFYLRVDLLHKELAIKK